MQNADHRAKITVSGHGAGIVSDVGAADRGGEAGPAARVLIRAEYGCHDVLNC